MIEARHVEVGRGGCGRRAVMGGILGNQVPLFLRHDLALTASSVEKLEQVEAAAAQTPASVQREVAEGIWEAVKDPAMAEVAGVGQPGHVDRVAGVPKCLVDGLDVL